MQDKEGVQLSSWGEIPKLVSIRNSSFIWHFGLPNVIIVQVVAIRDIVPPPQREVFNDVYIAYELMDTDLHQIIRSNQALSEEHCQVYI